MSDLAVRGDDLKALGLQEGPEVGRVLRLLLDEVVEDPGRNERDWLLARAAQGDRVTPASVREAYESVRAEAGPGVTVVAATKYVPLEQMGTLVAAGIEVVGENRAQDLARKHAEFGDAFRWHFIGALQSNKVKVVNGICELVHSVDTDSAARRLTVPAPARGQPGRGGVEERRRRARDRGLPGALSAHPRPHDDAAVHRGRGGEPARLRAARTARSRPRPAELSMGTSQDWRVAVEEGATLIRVGSTLFRS